MENNNDFTQLCVWTGCVLGEGKETEFNDFFKDEEGIKVRFAEEVKTLPNSEGEGNRNDLLFYVHNEDIPKLAVKRFKFDGISWWEDALSNWGEIYPSEIKSKYPKTW